MPIQRYLAMTPEEIRQAPELPGALGWMACHFAEEGVGHVPEALPEGALLILDDSIPMGTQDPEGIRRQLGEILQTFRCSGLLLDFERKGVDAQQRLAGILQEGLPCPVAVSEAYSSGLRGPVFLGACPAHIPLSRHREPWAGRELWLEAAPGEEIIMVTENGAEIQSSDRNIPLPHRDSRLHCHYGIRLDSGKAVFTLRRTGEDLEALLEEAENLGVTRAVGLWQEFR